MAWIQCRLDYVFIYTVLLFSWSLDLIKSTRLWFGSFKFYRPSESIYIYILWLFANWINCRLLRFHLRKFDETNMKCVLTTLRNNLELFRIYRTKSDLKSAAYICILSRRSVTFKMRNMKRLTSRKNYFRHTGGLLSFV